MRTEPMNLMTGREHRSQLLAAFAAQLAPMFVQRVLSSGAVLPSRDGSTEARIATDTYALAKAMLHAHMTALCDLLPFEHEPGEQAAAAPVRLSVKPGDVVLVKGSDHMDVTSSYAELESALPEGVEVACLFGDTTLQVIEPQHDEVTGAPVEYASLVEAAGRRMEANDAR